MKTNNLEKLFNAKSVAVVGVSNKEDNLARIIVDNLLRWQYKGKIYAVNPKGGEYKGIKIYPSLSEIPDKIELVSIFIPARYIPAVVEECGKLGITNIVIPSGGFSELDTTGEHLTNILKEKIKQYNLKIVGPNGLTIINAHTGLALPFFPVKKLKAGNIAVISQSGGVGLTLLMMLENENLGLSKFISMGNKMNLDETDYIQYIANDKETEIICIYMESIERGIEFIKTAKNINKPIIVFKANLYPQSNRIAMSHTAAIACDDDIFNAALKKAGIIRVNRLEDVINYAKIFMLPPPENNKIVAMSPAGGFAVMAADLCTEHGFDLIRLPENLLKEFEKHFRGGVIKLSNPIDMGDVYDPEILKLIVEKTISDPNVGSVFFIAFRPHGEETNNTAFEIFNNTNITDYINNLIRKYNKPIAIAIMTQNYAYIKLKHILAFPFYDDPKTTIKALAAYRDYVKNESPKVTLGSERSRPFTTGNKETPAKESKHLTHELLDILKEYGFSVPPYKFVTSPDEALAAADFIGYPVVMKAVAHDLSHKTEKGGVILDINDKESLILAYNNLIEKFSFTQSSLIDGSSSKPAPSQSPSPARGEGWGEEGGRGVGEGVLIQKMIKGGKEVFLGAKKDKIFGHVILFGLGGIYVEVMKDISMRLAPLDRQEAEEMVKEIKAFPILQGIRGERPYDINSLVDSLIKFSNLIMDMPFIKEIEINPLNVQESGCFVLDVKQF